MSNEVANKLKYLINKKKNVDYICETLNISLNELKDYLDYLKICNRLFEIVNNKVVKKDNLVKNVSLLPGYDTFELCLLSDLHLTSIYDRVDLLKNIYLECSRRGINYILCAGDFTNGIYPLRKEYNKHQRIIGFENIIDYVINEVPKYENICLYTISGNHDVTFNKVFGLSILEEISKRRDDIIFLGDEQGHININGISISLRHGTKLKGNNTSNRVERYYNSINEKPDVLHLGHIHQSMYLDYDKTHIFQSACLMDQTPYASTRKYNYEKSVYFVTIQVDKFSNIVRLIPELYDEKKLIKIKN